MPRPNALRTLAGEDSLAARIAYEREQRGWSYEGLAKRMTDVGCPVNQSAIYKIEKARPRRGIRVNELIALSIVLDLDLNELLLPPEAILDRETRDRLAGLVVGLESLIDYDLGLNEEWRQLRKHLDRPEARAYVEDRLQRIEREDVRRAALKALRKPDSSVFKVTLTVRSAEPSDRKETG